MLDTNQIDLLSAHGFSFKSSESPILWSHLESHFTGPRAVGSKFGHMPSNFVSELVSEGESVLLDDLAEVLRRTGSIEHVAHVLSFPYVVGTEAVISRADADPSKILSLIQSAGEYGEKLIQVLPTLADNIPCTNLVTVEGGLYADGHTAGYYDLNPGDLLKHGRGDDGEHIYMATPDEIRAIVYEMKEKLEDITSASKHDCEKMIEAALKAVG